VSEGFIDSADALRTGAKTLKIKLLPHEGKLVGRILATAGDPSVKNVTLPYVITMNRASDLSQLKIRNAPLTISRLHPTNHLSRAIVRKTSFLRARHGANCYRNVDTRPPCSVSADFLSELSGETVHEGQPRILGR
jgi:hypothetical protein